VELFLTYLAKGLLLPPAGNLLLLLMARLLRRWHRLAWWLVFASVASLYLLSAPITLGWLAQRLETLPAFDLADPAAQRIEAIVVPGTGRYTEPPEFDHDVVSIRTLERLRYAARVHRATGWPIAVVGGAPLDDAAPEGVLMAEALQIDFSVSARWIEDRSNNTAENARNARTLMNVDDILLVTQATDMARAKQAFEAVGFDVVPAPIGFLTREADGVISPFDFIPDANALAAARVVLHECLGLVWYRLRYGH
jgi:uncharacterized SAM-binding protein YcdF (DUF218 family)